MLLLGEKLHFLPLITCIYLACLSITIINRDKGGICLRGKMFHSHA